MKVGLQLKASQQLTMSPQLQQAIKLLQLSTIELHNEMLDQLYSNPLLELDEEHSADDNQSADNTPNSVEMADNDWQESATDQLPQQLPDELPVDANWDDIYTPTTSANLSAGDNEIDLDRVHQVTGSLRDHLQWQLNLTPFSGHDRQIAEAFVDAVDEQGFISTQLEQIIEHLQPAWDSEQPVIEEDELIAVLHRLQQFDPPGVFARDLNECLALQLLQLAPETPFLTEARLLASDHLEDIAAVDSSRLARMSRLDVGKVVGALQLIRSLNPHPGEAISSADTQYVVPDVSVQKDGGRWLVKLNSNNLPKLRINESYSTMIRRADSSDDNQYLKNNLTEARWFLRSLESRNETLLRVAHSIVEMQSGFLEHGPVAMKPMVLSNIAERLELHESTISRVTTNKYMATPRGVFELKYFFSSHVSTSGGGECSSTAVCAMLKEMINSENPAKPLSDNKLTALLQEQGIEVARRTVAKYRESINIPSSSQRKRF